MTAEKAESSKLIPGVRLALQRCRRFGSILNYVDSRLDDPEQFRAIGWVRGKLFSVIYEVREDGEVEIDKARGDFI